MVTVPDAVRAEVDDLPEPLRTIPQAAMCLALADAMDAATIPRDVAGVSRELRAALDALREAVNRAGKRGDVVDEIGKRRAARRSAATADPGPTAERQ